MKKTDEMIQIKGGTTYFPKIETSIHELEPLYVYGHVPPSFLRQILVNEQLIDEVIKKHRNSRPLLNDGYAHIKDLWINNLDELKDDLILFSNGKVDIIDFVFKYWIPYKKVRKFFKDMLPNEDVDTYWKQHKKYVQKKTTMTLYGVEHTAMLKEVQQKVINTTRKRYGVDNVMYSSRFKDKLTKTMKEKYGVTHNFQLKKPVINWKDETYSILNQNDTWKSILYEHFNTQETYLQHRDFIISKLINNKVEMLLKYWKQKTNTIVEYPNNVLFDIKASFNSTWLKHYRNLNLLSVDDSYLTIHTSYNERKIIALLDDHNIKYERNKRTLLDGLELDFYIPTKNIAIEINPNVTHNSNKYAVNPIRCAFNQVKPLNYHYQKYLKCKKIGITLIQLFSYDLADNVFDNLTKPRLLQQLKGYTTRIYARNTKIEKSVNIKQSRKFLNIYHTQGANKAQEYYDILYHNELIGVASFTQRKDKTYELKRLCFKPSIQVVGGVSKIINHYFKDHPTINELYSFSDNNYGNGNGYKASGAQFIKETGPSCIFVSPTNPSDRYSWQIATKWGIRNGVIANDVNNVGQTNNPDEYVEKYLTHRLDNELGYDRIYTSGSKLWKFER